MSCNSDIIKGNCAHSGGENEGNCIGEVIFLIAVEEKAGKRKGVQLRKERSGEKIQRDLFV